MRKKNKVATNGNIWWPAMWHKKNFLKGPLNYLAVLPQNFSQIEKGIVGQKMLFFSRFDLVNCINPIFLQKHAAPSCICPDRKDRLIIQVVLRSQTWKGKHQGGRACASLFPTKNFQLTRDGWQRRERQRFQEAFSQPQNYTELHNKTRLGKTEPFCPGSGESLQKHEPQPAEAEGGTKRT